MSLEFKPHAYQLKAIRHILNNDYCGLFLDMGLGKTVSTLTAIAELIRGMDISSVLVVAPKRVVELTWTDEVEKWAHLRWLKLERVIGTDKQRRAALARPAHVHLISCDCVAWLVALYGGGAIPFDMLVLDESSKFKNPSSLRFKALRQVRASMLRVVILTGTPSPNGLLDVWAQLYLVDRGERLFKEVTRFRNTYFDNWNHAYTIKNKRCADEIHAKIADVCLSMKAEDYLDLPPKIDSQVRVKLAPRVMRQYEEFERERILELAASASAEGGVVTVQHAAALANKLLQFANGALYDDAHEVHEVHDEKLEALLEQVEEANGQPVLVAYSFRHDLPRIKRALKDYAPREFKGRAELNDWNAGKIQVLLIHPASAGHGINLQHGGHIIVWFGHTWSLELEQQLNARLYRQGQTQPTIIRRLVAVDTMDEEVLRALERKERGQSELMEALKARIEEYVKQR